jgi:hypothetical protein
MLARLGRRTEEMRRLRPAGPLVRRLTIAGACLASLAGLPDGGTAEASRGHAARTLTLHEIGNLRLTSHHSFTLNERGSTSGTISGTIYIHLNVVSTNHVTAEVNIYPAGSSLTGHATASYHPSGAQATFSGTMTVVRGTGRYSGAHGSGLSFSGTIQRTNDAVTVHVNGSIST